MAITENHERHLFSNACVCVCVCTCSEFLWRLESCQSDATLIARCFSQHSHAFSVYSSYCTNYPRYIVSSCLLCGNMRTNISRVGLCRTQLRLTCTKFNIRPYPTGALTSLPRPLAVRRGRERTKVMRWVKERVRESERVGIMRRERVHGMGRE